MDKDEGLKYPEMDVRRSLSGLVPLSGTMTEVARESSLIPLTGTMTEVVRESRPPLDEDGRIIRSANTTPRLRFRERRSQDYQMEPRFSHTLDSPRITNSHYSFLMVDSEIGIPGYDAPLKDEHPIPLGMTWTEIFDFKRLFLMSCVSCAEEANAMGNMILGNMEELSRGKAHSMRKVKCSLTDRLAKKLSQTFIQSKIIGEPSRNGTAFLAEVEGGTSIVVKMPNDRKDRIFGTESRDESQMKVLFMKPLLVISLIFLGILFLIFHMSLVLFNVAGNDVTWQSYVRTAS